MSYSNNATCFECGCACVMIVLDSRYNGYRGRCPKCGGDWPES